MFTNRDSINYSLSENTSRRIKQLDNEIRYKILVNETLKAAGIPPIL